MVPAQGQHIPPKPQALGAIPAPAAFPGQAADAKGGELKGFLDSAPRKDGKLTTTAEAKARKVLEAG